MDTKRTQSGSLLLNLLREVAHEQFRVFDLHFRRDTARLPVVHTLGATVLLQAEQFSDLGRTTKAFNLFRISHIDHLH